MDDGSLPDIAGKVVLFYVKSDAKKSVLMDNPQFTQYDGRMFVHGKFSEALPENMWVRGLNCSVAWSEVESFIEFNSASDYQARIKLGNDKK